MNKKGSAGILITILILVLITTVVTVWGNAHLFSQRQCNENRDCLDDQYCGADFACHDFPAQEKTIVQHEYGIAALILGIAIVFAAIIIKGDSYSLIETIKDVRALLSKDVEKEYDLEKLEKNEKNKKV